MATRFIEDDKVYQSDKEKNARLSDLLLVDMRNEKITAIKREEGSNKGWSFTTS